jgi:hypothetical protein
MPLKWKDTRNVCMLSSTHNKEVQTACGKRGGEKYAYVSLESVIDN